MEANITQNNTIYQHAKYAQYHNIKSTKFNLQNLTMQKQYDIKLANHYTIKKVVFAKP